MYLDPDRDLIGRKEIAKMTRRSWKTIRKWIENDGFPAKKLDGVWESNARLITEWRIKRLTSGR